MRKLSIILVWLILSTTIVASGDIFPKNINSKNNQIVIDYYALETNSWVLFNLNRNITVPPIVADLFTNNTRYTLVISNLSISLLRIDTNIHYIWNYTSSENYPFTASPITVDFDGDGWLEICLLDSAGNVHFLNPLDGTLIQLIRTEKTPLDLYSNLAAFDIDGDGCLDAVFLARRYIISVSLKSLTPTIYTIEPTSHDITSGPTIIDFDLDQNRTHHVIFASTYRLTAFRPHDGFTYYDLPSPIVLFGGSGNYTADTVDVSPYEFPLITLQNNILFVAFAYDPANSVRFNITIDDISKSRIPPVSADFDADGFDEMFIAHINGSLYFIGNIGIEKSYIINSNITSSPAISDIDDNGYPDVIMTGSDGSIIGVDWLGVKSLGTLNRPSWPIIDDIDNDGLSEILVVINNGLALYQLGISSNPWPCYFHDSRRTNNLSTPHDTDGDGIPDTEEVLTDRFDSDTDDDRIIDFTELFVTQTNPLDDDTDKDGLPDGWEYTYGLNPLDSDTDSNGVLDPAEDLDNDNITNINEFLNNTSPITNDTDEDGIDDYREIAVYRTDPTNPDTDGDGMPDGWEIENKLDPLDSTDALRDLDNDGLLNKYEYSNSTDPTNPDTDGDGMPDGWEIENKLDPLDSTDAKADNDDDGLPNGLEYKIRTNPLNNDTDGDGMPDGWEYTYGLDPTDPTDNLTDPDNDGVNNINEYKHGTNPKAPDTDGDGMPDGWEIENKLDPLDSTDAYLDADSDGLTNKEEYTYGTDPNNPDTDGDGLTDSTEVLIYHSDPLRNDTDGDGLTDSAEIALNTDPNNPDTDGDGISDYDEILRGSDPLDPTNGFYKVVFLTIITLVSLGLFASMLGFVIRRKREIK